MRSVQNRFSPKRTLLGLLLATLIGVTFAYDHQNRTRIRDILLTSIHSSNILIQSNNYQMLSFNLYSLKEANPFVNSLGIYMLGEKRTGFGDLPDDFILAQNSLPDAVNVRMTGFFSYDAYYLFSNTQTLLYGNFSEPSRVWVLSLIYLVTLLSFGLIY